MPAAALPRQSHRIRAQPHPVRMRLQPADREVDVDNRSRIPRPRVAKIQCRDSEPIAHQREVARLAILQIAIAPSSAMQIDHQRKRAGAHRHEHPQLLRPVCMLDIVEVGDGIVERRTAHRTLPCFPTMLRMQCHPDNRSCRGLFRAAIRRMLGLMSASRFRLGAVLGVNQTLSWGMTFYLPAIVAGPVAAAFGRSAFSVLGAFSWALLVTGACAPRVGRWIDRHGGRGALLASIVVIAIGQIVLASSTGLALWYLGWTIIGVG